MSILDVDLQMKTKQVVEEHIKCYELPTCQGDSRAQQRAVAVAVANTKLSARPWSVPHV